MANLNQTTTNNRSFFSRRRRLFLSNNLENYKSLNIPYINTLMKNYEGLTRNYLNVNSNFNNFLLESSSGSLAKFNEQVAHNIQSAFRNTEQELNLHIYNYEEQQ